MIVLDANILIRAVLGRRVRQLIETYRGRGTRFFAPDVALCQRRSNICATSLSQLTARSTASLKTRRDCACVVATKTIGPCWLLRSDWHVGFGRRMQTSSELASRHGQQIASRSSSRHKQSQPNLRKAEKPNTQPPALTPRKNSAPATSSPFTSPTTNASSPNPEP